MKNLITVDSILHAAKKRATKQLHFINPIYNINGGSAQRIREIGRILRGDFEPTLWIGENLHVSPGDLNTLGIPIRKVRPRLLSFPRGGVIFIVGIYFWIGNWLRFSYPEKVVLLINTPPNEGQIQRIERIRRLVGQKKVVVAVAARWIGDSLGLACPTVPSPVDLKRFSPKLERQPTHYQKKSSTIRKFVVGRLSRDVDYKHHPDDADLYMQLVRLGFFVRIMGGSVLRERLRNIGEIEILEEGSMPPEAFLRSLDAFIYRTDPKWIEPHGRVIHEAMASGIPILWGPAGGFVEWLEPSIHGFQFSINEEAVAALMKLRADTSLSKAIGMQCRTDVEVALSEEAVRTTLLSLIESGHN